MVEAVLQRITVALSGDPRGQRLARRILVYTGTRELRTAEGIEVWPLAKLLTALAEGTLWP